MINEAEIVNSQGSAAPKAEEFFERALFQDVLEMKSIKEVSDATALQPQQLRDDVYDCLFKFFQKTRGVNSGESGQNEMFAVFELFFKNYYQHFRLAMEGLITEHSPVQVAYALGMKSDRLIKMLDQFIKEVETELGQRQ
jgi:hypothetical protein